MLNIFLLAMILFAGCEREVIVPQHLTGEWRTSAPRCEDIYLKFSEQTLIFGVSVRDGEEITHMIDKIKMKQSDGGTIYTFHYRDAEGQKDSLTVTYWPGSGGTLQIKNSNAVWKKVTQGQAGG